MEIYVTSFGLCNAEKILAFLTGLIWSLYYCDENYIINETQPVHVPKKTDSGYILKNTQEQNLKHLRAFKVYTLPVLKSNR